MQIRFFLSALVFFFSCVPIFAKDLPPPESAPVLKTTDMIEANLLQGTGYSVEANASTEGYLGNFTLNTSFGPMKIRGTDLLRVRISEIPAMQKLDEVSKTEVFAKSLASSAVKPLKSIQKVADDPVGTVKGIPEGVGRFFKKTKKAVEKGVDAAKNSNNDDSGNQSSSSGAMKDISGMNKTKREWAKQLNVDPYTTNPVLNKQLDDIALAAFAGGLTVKVTLPKPPGPVTKVIRVSNLVWDMPPEDLQETNKKKMMAMGITEENIKAFFKNPHFTPTTQTALVASLEELSSVQGRQEAIIPAISLESEEEARFFVGSVSLLGHYHKSHPLKRLLTSGKAIAGITSENALIVSVDLDYIPWTQEVKEFCQREELRHSKRMILISGRLSPKTQKGLEELGWKFQENYVAL